MYRAVLVDDEPLVLEGLQLMVEWRSCGFEVVGEARDGEDALALIRQKKPDLVVTDIRMPVMSGLELIQETRRLMNDETRFILLSGYGEFDYVRAAMQHKVLDYMLKPIEPERFTDVLGKLRADFERAGRLADRAVSAVKTRKDARTGCVPAVETAARLVRERFNEQLKLSDIAREVHLDAAYLGVLFKRTMGDSFHGYLHRTRIEEAKKLLRRTDLKIAEIGRRSGYRDTDDFARRFKEIVGMLPSEYKRSIGRGG